MVSISPTRLREEESKSLTELGTKAVPQFGVDRSLQRAAPTSGVGAAGNRPQAKNPNASVAAIPLFIDESKKKTQLAEQQRSLADTTAEFPRQDTYKTLGGTFARSDGAEAIAISQTLAAYRSKERAQNTDSTHTIRYLGRRIFYFVRGTWTDRNFKAEMKTITLTYASDDYFARLQKHPELAPAFALGESVIVVLADKLTGHPCGAGEGGDTGEGGASGGAPRRSRTVSPVRRLPVRHRG